MKLKSNIVKLEKRHIPSVAKLEEECFSTPWSEKQLSEELENPCAHFFVAECDGKVCGYIGIHTVLDEGYITNVAVGKDYRRCGIGRALVEKIICELNELSFVTLEVRTSNEPAIALYKKLGFEEVGTRKNYYTNPCEDARLMTRFREK